MTLEEGQQPPDLSPLVPRAATTLPTALRDPNHLWAWQSVLWGESHPWAGITDPGQSLV